MKNKLENWLVTIQKSQENKYIQPVIMQILKGDTSTWVIIAVNFWNRIIVFLICLTTLNHTKLTFPLNCAYLLVQHLNSIKSILLSLYLLILIIWSFICVYTFINISDLIY